MSNHVQNPQYKPHHELGFTDAEWDALKALVQTVLDSESACPTVEVATLRDVDSVLAVSDPEDETDMGDRNWAQLSADMGLFEMPGPST